MRRRSLRLVPAAGATCFGLSLALTACLSIEMDFQRLPPAEALASIEPGLTTRSEVLTRLGPPDEMRSIPPPERARFTSPQRRRVVEAGEIFGDDAYTYAASRRTIENFGLLPIGVAILRVGWRISKEDRWRIEFDADDVVSAVARIEELEE